MDRVDLLEIVQPGILASVQDVGRQGYRQIGVAPSGAADSYACRIGNLLVGNLEDAAAVEITLMGFEARFRHEAVVAVTGADLGAGLNGAPLPMWTALRAAPGDVLAVKAPVCGCRAYLAVGGGFSLPAVMGSRATNIGAGFGGYHGRALAAGDVLPGIRPGAHLHCIGRTVPDTLKPVYASACVLGAIPGPQTDQFTTQSRARFNAAVYTVSATSDRTGVRLEGPVLDKLPGAPDSILSEGIVAGAVQVPGDGRPIILLNETVTGGYRKIAVVAAADLPLLGQLAPGDTVRFQATDIPTAVARLRRVEAAVDWVRACWAD
ncbi:MAG: biotin-dependent carboxyltransferase family protein [Desulfobacterales bacterium]|nr:biotin-dependent carboxyltransferase family protein [Desulfobacterales bacterium]MDJ0887578.1 biotin-dependent carboxyltransferase family protein [Desulfobacterales bacterium]